MSKVLSIPSSSQGDRNRGRNRVDESLDQTPSTQNGGLSLDRASGSSHSPSRQCSGRCYLYVPTTPWRYTHCFYLFLFYSMIVVVFIGISLIGDAIIPSITLITASSQCDMAIEYPPSIYIVSDIGSTRLIALIFFLVAVTFF